MLSSSSPIFALSDHTTFSQTQTGATVPLSTFGWGIIHYLKCVLLHRVSSKVQLDLLS